MEWWKKKQNRGLEDVESGQSGREADRDYTDFNTDQIQIIHGAVSVHVTRDWHGKIAHSDGRQ